MLVVLLRLLCDCYSGNPDGSQIFRQNTSCENIIVKVSLIGHSQNKHPTKISMHMVWYLNSKEGTQQQRVFSSPVQGHAVSCSRSACVIPGSSVVGSGSICLALMSNGDLGTNSPQNSLNIRNTFLHGAHRDSVLIPTNFRRGALKEPYIVTGDIL